MPTNPHLHPSVSLGVEGEFGGPTLSAELTFIDSDAFWSSLHWKRVPLCQVDSAKKWRGVVRSLSTQPRGSWRELDGPLTPHWSAISRGGLVNKLPIPRKRSAGPVLQFLVANVHESEEIGCRCGRSNVALVECENHGASHATLPTFDLPSSETVSSFSGHFVESHWVTSQLEIFSF